MQLRYGCQVWFQVASRFANKQHSVLFVPDVVTSHSCSKPILKILDGHFLLAVSSRSHVGGIIYIFWFSHFLDSDRTIFSKFVSMDENGTDDIEVPRYSIAERTVRNSALTWINFGHESILEIGSSSSRSNLILKL